MNINLFVYIPFFRTTCSNLSNQYLLKLLPSLDYNSAPLGPES